MRSRQQYLVAANGAVPPQKNEEIERREIPGTVGQRHSCERLRRAYDQRRFERHQIVRRKKRQRTGRRLSASRGSLARTAKSFSIRDK